MPLQTITQHELAQYSHAQLMALFATLPAPEMAEMQGEFAARLLAQPSKWATVIGNITIDNPFLFGHWLCKAFRPISALEGRGYNTFRQRGQVIQRFPMQTQIAPSRYDGKPAYTLIYRAYRSLCGDIHMVDEVRRVASGLYLGVGTWGFHPQQRQIPLPFLLTGPIGPYRGDMGQPRASWSIATEVPAYRTQPRS